MPDKDLSLEQEPVEVIERPEPTVHIIVDQKDLIPVKNEPEPPKTMTLSEKVIAIAAKIK